jgi:hypothetical protein
MSDDSLDLPEKSQQTHKKFGTYSNKPPLWFVVTVWLFPVWWLMGYLSALSVTTRLATLFGCDLPGLLSQQGLVAPFYVIPVLWGSILLKTNNWFRRRFGYMVVVWLIAIVVFDVTQGAMSQAFWCASGCPIRDSLENIESRDPDRYLPNRCDDHLNRRASRILAGMGEKVICAEQHHDFVCRLLVFRPLGGPISCFRIDKKGHDRAVLYYKTFEMDPDIFADVMTKFEKATMRSREYPLPAAKLNEFVSLLPAAKDYYSKNKFRSYLLDISQEQYLLEFQIFGNYFYYGVQGPAPARAHAVGAEPIPDAFQHVFDFCKQEAGLR